MSNFAEVNSVSPNKVRCETDCEHVRKLRQPLRASLARFFVLWQSFLDAHALSGIRLDGHERKVVSTDGPVVACSAQRVVTRRRQVRSTGAHGAIGAQGLIDGAIEESVRCMQQ
ncbi:hypothetical protein [Massilia varians]|uniref:hypothetical protein n=1 Tax=Massilia varians TaxID=457921 RepID=UPI002554CF38|nr:hypothetical protein [Massilia varians]MDK6077385.1 hypothetical protein [Massilia varians]